jgi:hypothetical protein
VPLAAGPRPITRPRSASGSAARPPRQTTCRSRSRVRRLAFLRGRPRPFSVLARAVPVNLTGAKLKTGDQDGTKSAAPASKFSCRTGLRDAAPGSAVVHTSPRQLQTLVLGRHEARGTRVCICIETLASPVSSALRPGQGRQRGAPCDRRAAQCGGRKRPRQRRGRERAPRPGPPPTPRRCRLTCLTDVHDCRPSRQLPGSMTTTAGDGGRPRHSTLPAPTRQMQRRGMLWSTVIYSRTFAGYRGRGSGTGSRSGGRTGRRGLPATARQAARPGVTGDIRGVSVIEAENERFRRQ